MNFKRYIFPIVAIFIAALNLRPVITSVSPLLETIRESLNMSAALASLLTALPVLCMGIFAPFAVKITKRLSIEKTIAYSLLLICISTATRYFATSSWIMLLTAFTSGIGIAIIGPLLSGFIKKTFPNPSSIVGVYSLAVAIGAAFGAAFSIPLTNVFNSSWQTSVASWCLLALVATFFWIKPRKKEIELENKNDSITNEIDLKSVLKSKQAWLLTSFFAILACMFYCITTWLPSIVHDMGYSKQTSGMVLTLFSIVQMPVSFLIPILVSRCKKRIILLVGCSSMELIGLITLLLSISPWISSIFLGIGAGGLFSLGLALPIDEASSTKEANMLAAMTQSVGYIFAALGPFLIGIVRDLSGSFTPSIIGMIICVIIMILIQIKIGNKKPKRTSN